MTKRGTIRIFSFTFAAFLCLAVFGINSTLTANSYKARLELNYQQSLNTLAECMNGIETNLTKSVYASSPTTLADISSNLYAETGTAKETLSRLPIDQMNLGGTYKFLSQAGDYASYLNQKIRSGEEISQEEHDNLNKLLDYCTKYKGAVDSLVTICNSGGSIMDRNVKSPINGNDVAAINADFSDVEEAFEDYPTLLYDGPFADAILNKQSEMLKKSHGITEEAAREIAAKALNCNISELNYDTDEYGNMPCYVYSYSQYTVGITKKGGYVAYVLFGGKISNNAITEENAVNIAKSYLDTIGYKNMKNSYYAIINNVCVVNFAYVDNGVICYSDLIKVGISMDSGKVVSLEAKGFLTNHIERTDMTAKISMEEAKSGISKYVKVKNAQKCIIPKENGKEYLCWEFHVESSKTGEEALVYVNANNGEEENILLLLYSDSGTLTK